MAEKKTTKSSKAESTAKAAPKTSKGKKGEPKPVANEKAVHRHLPQKLTAAQFAAARALPPGTAKALKAHAGNVRKTEPEWRAALTAMQNKRV